MAFQPQPSTSVQIPNNSSLNVTPVAPIQNSTPATSPQEQELMRKHEMVTTLASQTGMNFIWSEK